MTVAFTVEYEYQLDWTGLDWSSPMMTPIRMQRELTKYESSFYEDCFTL